MGPTSKTRLILKAFTCIEVSLETNPQGNILFECVGNLTRDNFYLISLRFRLLCHVKMYFRKDGKLKVRAQVSKAARWRTLF